MYFSALQIFHNLFFYLNKWIAEGKIGEGKRSEKFTKAENSSGLS